jgi:hypothetical protein
MDVNFLYEAYQHVQKDGGAWSVKPDGIGRLARPIEERAIPNPALPSSFG